MKTENYEHMNEAFLVQTICRADILGMFDGVAYDYEEIIEQLDTQTMEYIAKKIGDIDNEYFFDELETIVRDEINIKDEEE